MSAESRPYYSPADVECFDIATSSVNKTFTFNPTDQNSNPVTIAAEAKAVVVHNGNVVQTYTVGNGIVLSNSDTQAVLTINGADFEDYPGMVLDVQCSLINVGDVEAIFQLLVVKSYL